MWRLDNPIQPYAWGSRRAIAALQGRPPAQGPEAELWMGAHPRAPSCLAGGRSLAEAIAADPAAMLGSEVSRDHDGRLPFLLKVLAAAQPLSLQAHPDAAQAKAGFDREEAAGVDRGASHRNYRDPHDKPELVCALEPFAALCGFRTLADTRALVAALGVPALRRVLEPLWSRPEPEALAAVVRRLLTHPEPGPIVEAVAEACRTVEGGAQASTLRWLDRLAERYPGDPGVLVASLLSLVELQPGEALFLGPGRLHCYLEGTAVEIMRSSDNVLRGGLTIKHVDVPELLRVLETRAVVPQVLRARATDGVEAIYPTPATAFALSRLELDVGRSWTAAGSGPEIVLCTGGHAHLHALRGEARVSLKSGDSAFVPAASDGWSVRAVEPTTLFRATVGRPAAIGGE